MRGAFTGAVADTKGLLRAADGGTVFLDEIAELPPQLQVRLLRVLEDRQVRPAGSTNSVHRLPRCRRYELDARGAVRRASRARPLLPAERCQGRPSPLRERREDIPALVAHFLRDLNERFGRRVKGVSAEAMEAFAHDFPGNVRELEHLLERALALGALGRRWSTTCPT